MPEREIESNVGAAFAPPIKATPVPWSAKAARRMDGETMLRAMVASCLAQIRPNADAIARGSRDPEHVHQLRVGLRRLRSAVRGMRPFEARLPPGWELAIRPVFDALGQARDRQVQATELAARLREAGAPVDDLAGPSEEEARALRRLVRADAFQGVLRRLAAFAEAPVAEADRGDKGAGIEQLERELRKLKGQVTRAARGFDKLPFARQHQVRKRLKRLRYLAAFAAPAFGRKAVDEWMAEAAPAQDRLGELIDFALAAERFASSPAAPWLRAQSERAARRARKSLRRLRDTPAFW